VDSEASLEEPGGLDRLLGRSRAMARVLEQARTLARSTVAVLIEGEPGTGKQLMARSLHHDGERRNEPFVTVSCAALEAAAFETELFGLESRAGIERRGAFERAHHGTLYLDEVGELGADSQRALLRAILGREHERVGGDQPIRSDVRLLAATRRDLAADVRAGRFRDDLLQRLATVRIQLPPLRERREDIPLLAEHFLGALNLEFGRRVTGLTPGVLDRLEHYAWPGNVRELQRALEHMVALAEGVRALEPADLPAVLQVVESAGDRLELAVGMTVEDAERRLVAATLRHTGGDKPRAAAMLGIGLRTLYRKIAGDERSGRSRRAKPGGPPGR
jgi:two-component system, NtrC family, response regulator HydG